MCRPQFSSPGRLELAVAVLALALVGCGESTGPDLAGDDTMTASIDGAPFEAFLVEVAPGAPSTLNMVGTTNTASSPVTQVSLLVTGVSGPGTFALESSSFPSTLALVTVTAGSTPSQWSTTNAAGPGSLTITSLSTDRVVGTFQFVADPDPGTAATGQVSVTNGAFDVTF